ncbi:hypothetical protein GCM10009609_62630 [Pseudonocardia aurantiaca]|uniref:Cyanobacterial TRADD-N associated 2 transmembrane domain-containing protein n=1 Tax=Pseudonocardia aurantiaca TaxID=75290 RepID=A0ABW4FSN7_9PSEU
MLGILDTTLLASNVVKALLVSKNRNIHEFELSAIGRKCRTRRFFLYVLAASTACATGILIAFGRFAFALPADFVLATAIAGGLIAVTLAGIGAFQYNQDLVNFVPEMALEQERKAEEERLRELTDTSLPAMLKFNRDQMVLYHTIATTQARVAGRNSQLAIAAGFVLLIAGAVIAILSPDMTTKIVTASLAGLGGIFSGYITKTFFVAQDRAIQQLYSYWQQPLTTSYLLAAERVATQVDASSREVYFAELLKHTLRIVSPQSEIGSDLGMAGGATGSQGRQLLDSGISNAKEISSASTAQPRGRMERFLRKPFRQGPQ